MPDNLDQYRGVVGVFNSRLHCKNIYNNISIRKLDVLPIPTVFLSMILTLISSICFVKLSVLPFYSATISKSRTYW